ncbi:MAG: hypothetical protein KJ065_25130 [Anaerolineae bacterium]|nr:hypothetical protein [Anaerolineae bacterium]
MSEATFTYLTSISLQHSSDCCLLGLGGDLTLYSEEIYGEDGLVAQAAHTLEGKLIAAVDEGLGHTNPLELPTDIVHPYTAWHTMSLNFAGARHRGIRADEQIDSLVHPLTLEEKVFLAASLNLPVPAPMVLGLAESYSLAEAPITSRVYCVCRRLRIAYALPVPKRDHDGYVYDYDTVPLYVAHLHTLGTTDTATLTQQMSYFPGVRLRRPMDCLAAFDHLCIADGGADDRRSAVHIWRIDGIEKAGDSAEKRWQALYG